MTTHDNEPASQLRERGIGGGGTLVVGQHGDQVARAQVPNEHFALRSRRRQIAAVGRDVGRPRIGKEAASTGRAQRR